MKVKGSGVVKPEKYYETSLSLGELEQKTWEAIPEKLDSSLMKTCKCCNATLLEEDFFEPVIMDGDKVVTTRDTCRICIAKERGKQGTLKGLDLSVLKLFNRKELKRFKIVYRKNKGASDVTFEVWMSMQDRFSNFLRYAWHHLGLPSPTPAQIEFCNFLQDEDEHTIVNAFRGIGKSWITSVFVVWKLWLNNDLKILVISASKERADSFSIFTKRLLSEFPVLFELIPDGERTSNKSFDIGDIAPAHAPSVKSAGITGQITGSRADIIIADDVEVIDNSATEDAREKLMEKCKDFVSILTPEKASRIIYLGTPQTEESIYDKLSDMGYLKYVIPARYPEQPEKYKGFLAPFVLKAVVNNPEYVGKAVDPERFDDAELLRRELLIGKSTFALQFMLDTELSDADKYPLKLSDFIVTDLDVHKVFSHISYASGKHQQIKDITNMGFSGDRLFEAGFTEMPMINYQGVCAYIDPSGRGKDETAYAIVGIAMGRLHLLDWGGLSGTGYSEENMTILAKKLKEYYVKAVIIESNFGDGMFTKLFSPVVRRTIKHCAIIEDKAVTNKFLRMIETLEPLLNSHRIVIDRTAIKNEIEWVNVNRRERLQYSLLYQLTRVTKLNGCIAHDDRLDAVTGACAYWLEFLNKDIDKAVKDAKKKLLLDELKAMKKHHDKLFGIKQANNSSRARLLSKGGIRGAKNGNKNSIRRSRNVA